MSRSSDDAWDEDFNNQSAFWAKSAELALNGKRGRRALAVLREALMALPEKRLIAGALCTVGDTAPYRETYRAEKGEGVCAVGAYIWHMRVKAGVDPQWAFDSLPTLGDEDSGIRETAEAGRDAGLTYTLAYILADMNDGFDFGNLTPEERWTAFIGWIDDKLANPVAA